MIYTFTIEPMGAPRMTRQDKWAQRPVVMRYKEFGIALRKQAKELNFTMPASGAWLRFYIPMPSTWSQKRKRETNGKPHTSKPDVDNLVKASIDSLFYVPKGSHDRQTNDSYINDIRISKYWSYEGKIEVEVTHSLNDIQEKTNMGQNKRYNQGEISEMSKESNRVVHEGYTSK